jgi:hypothetical protein
MLGHALHHDHPLTIPTGSTAHRVTSRTAILFSAVRPASSPASFEPLQIAELLLDLHTVGSVAAASRFMTTKTHLLDTFCSKVDPVQVDWKMLCNTMSAFLQILRLCDEIRTP